MPSASALPLPADRQLAEKGTHEELIKEKDGLYAKLWSLQAGGFMTRS